jgi:hypothetical protein
MRASIGLSLAGLTLAVISWAQTTPQRATAAKASPPPMAEWKEFPWSAMIGMDQEEFHQLGLDKLSAIEGTKLGNYFITNRPAFSCSKYYPATQKEELKHIHLYIESGSAASAEFTGNLRARFSGIHDAALVYSDDDADLIIIVLAMPSIVSGREVGYLASAVIMLPCTYRSPAGYDRGTIISRRFEDHYIQIGPSRDEIAAAIANTVNVRDFDEVRRDHAATLKLYENR